MQSAGHVFFLLLRVGVALGVGRGKRVRLEIKELLSFFLCSCRKHGAAREPFCPSIGPFGQDGTFEGCLVYIYHPHARHRRRRSSLLSPRAK